MKYLLLIAVFAAAALYGAETPEAELSRLRKEYDALYSQSLANREKAIRADPELLKLRNEIVQQQRELADKLSKDPQVKQDTEKLEDLEERMEDLEKRIRKK